MNLAQILAVLKAWRLLIAACFALVLITSLAVTSLMPKTYTASASVLIDIKSPDPVAGMILPGMVQPSYIGTQVDVLRSERVALGVIKQFNLLENTAMREQWLKKTGGAGSFESWLSTLLLSSLDIKPAKESTVINIEYAGAEPGFAAAMANAFVDNYIKTSLELRVEPAKRYNTMFGEQIKQASERLEQAQVKLSEYQRAKGLVATDEKLDIENARLAELSSQLVAIQAVATESTTRNNQASGNADRIQEVLNNGLLSNLKADLSQQERRLKELLVRYGEEHPLVREQRASTAELRTRIEQETRRITSSMAINSNVNQTREAQVRLALEAQRQKVFRLKELRDEAAVLLREVDGAQKAYDTLVNRVNYTGIESQSTQTNVSVVKRATPPAAPSSPKLALSGILGAAVGLILGVGIAFLLEFINRRIRGESDVMELGIPMLGTISESKVISPKSFSDRLLPLSSAKPLKQLGAPGA
ncbi:chain length determinant protein EpsF [Aquabacterium sp.]|jgi:succinoglycan biosynthesis transport protein ExoP|uniref:chain length determinant protein EpsF n=1 Tax=Aquabacterium sp. TaxID=1872578 RepID=UPI0025C0593C|nr:chain length determinant protein EpsF [Aquabacterium sp.]